MLRNALIRNRWACEHGWDIDLDDGSSNFHIVENLCLCGGIKLREGFLRVVENNIMVHNTLHPPNPNPGPGFGTLWHTAAPALSRIPRTSIQTGITRRIDAQLLESRYRRGDLHKPHPGEHAIEHQILCANFERISCLGYKLVDGINAIPLSRDARGVGRRGNVEADMPLPGQLNGAYRLFLCEVKDRANDPWYAVVEGLRQLRLFLENTKSHSLFAHRGLVGGLPSEIPVTSLVVRCSGLR